MSARTWSILGKTKLRPKKEGMGIMVSAVFDEWRGFGLQLTESEVNLINNVREAAALLAGVPPRKKI
jgi:two-component sensor histidine kinase